jgi:isochorismate pyruvate lyase
MEEVRDGVDAVDRHLVELLAKRFAYMDAAARIKPDRNAVRDDARKAQVIQNVRNAAQNYNLPEDALAGMWEILIEASIAYELEQWDSLRP